MEEIGCRACDYRVPLYVRLMSGEQRSGYRMLQQHRLVAHKQRGRGVAVAEDRCPHCEGTGCEHCEPRGKLLYNGNTGEPCPTT